MYIHVLVAVAFYYLTNFTLIAQPTSHRRHFVCIAIWSILSWIILYSVAYHLIPNYTFSSVCRSDISSNSRRHEISTAGTTKVDAQMVESKLEFSVTVSRFDSMLNLNMTNINNDKNRFRLAHFWFNSSKNVPSVRMCKEHIFRSLKYYAFHISYRVHNNYKTIFQTCFQVTKLFYVVSTSGFQ